MGEFNNLAVALNKIDVHQILRDITKESDVQRWVSNTIKGRIQRTGIDAKGNKMQTDSSSPGESYSDATIGIKETHGSGIGKISRHVTLTDSGDFWRSFKIMLTTEGFKTIADFQKPDGNMYENFTQDYSSQRAFENAVTGLTEDELNNLVNVYYYPRFIKKLNEILS